MTEICTQYFTDLFSGITRFIFIIINQAMLGIILLGILGTIMGASMPNLAGSLADVLEILLQTACDLAVRVLRLAVWLMARCMPTIGALLAALAQSSLKLLEKVLKYIKGLIDRTRLG